MNLLSSCTSGGCGAKIGPGELRRITGALPKFDDQRLLVGFDGSDDGCVYRLDEVQSLVSTVDFFPPMVEDPRIFGRIAAANALSDIYAMGARPLFALNIVCFPQGGEMEALAEILQGGAEKVLEAGAVIGGGHSIYDREVKYGLCVTGTVRDGHVLRNDTPREGDSLILTKPLGTGIILAAQRVQMADAAAYEAALAVMQRLNRDAAEAMEGFSVSACTDVTGFGLLAHAHEMAGTHMAVRIDPDALPIQRNVLGYAAEYLTTAAGQRNRNHLRGDVDVRCVSREMQEVLFDPQTSGGLLIAVARDEAEALLSQIRQNDPDAALIGGVRKRVDSSVELGTM